MQTLSIVNYPLSIEKIKSYMKFKEFGFVDDVLDGLEAMRFENATPIQEQTIPIIMEGRDLIACAQTGTGKTAAYVLPVINELSKGGYPDNEINAIIMAPTRELAQQIDQQIEGFSYYMPISAVAVYGGTDGIAYAQQERGLQMGADIVIATPGRLIAHLNLASIDLSHVSFFILDEADRMLDMGFFDDIMRVVKQLPKDRQTIMFSATMPPKIRQLAKTILNNPAEVKIAVSRPPESIMQTAYICHEGQKNGIIRHLFSTQDPNKVILFSGSKLKVKEITRSLRMMKLSVGEMHSDLDQAQRDHIMHEFRNGRVNMLVATDIVSRGIDIDDISLIINYDVPHDVEDYVHRIGRTARASAKGMAITLVSEMEQHKFKQIEEFLEKDIYKIPVPEELGEAPAYDPERYRRTFSKDSKFKGRGSKGNNGQRPRRNDQKPRRSL